VLIALPWRGLLPPETKLTMQDFQKISTATIDLADERYVDALQRDARLPQEQLGSGTRVVLLGSKATPSRHFWRSLGLDCYSRPLFTGRGNMSSGGLMLRCVRENIQLNYVSVGTAMPRGPRPANLPAQQG